MNDTEKWVPVNANNSGSIIKDATPAPGGLGGESSLKISTKATNNDWGYIAAIQSNVRTKYNVYVKWYDKNGFSQWCWFLQCTVIK